MKTMIMLILLSMLSCKKSVNTIPLNLANNHILLPVSINGKTNNFYFDTGSAISFLPESMADSLGIEKGLEQKIRLFAIKSLVTCFRSKKKVEIKIGNYTLKEYMLIEPKSGNMVNMPVLGMNFIEKLHWSIDFQREQILFSKGSIPEDLNAKVLSLKYSAPDSKVGISFSDSLVYDLTMDTGYNSRLSENDLSPDFILWNTDINPIGIALGQKKRANVSAIVNQRRFMIVDTLYIHSTPIEYPCIIADHHSFYDTSDKIKEGKGLITMRFITRFSQLNINPRKRTFDLSLLESDTSRNQSKINQYFFNEILKRYRSDDGK